MGELLVELLRGAAAAMEEEEEEELLRPPKTLMGGGEAVGAIPTTTPFVDAAEGTTSGC